MTHQRKVSDLPVFDMAEYLGDEQAVAEYLSIVLEENDPAAFVEALGEHLSPSKAVRWV